MKRIFCVLSALLLLCLCLTGCSKEMVLQGFDRALEEVGELLLTRDSRLVGERAFGADCYVGGYIADYRDFDGFETLFGGTGIRREAGEEITLRCRLEVEAGEARLLFRCGAEEDRVLLEDSGVLEQSLQLPAGGNYICLEGKDFSGSICLEIE